MTSADFSQQLLAVFQKKKLSHVCETSRGKIDNFLSIYLHHLLPCIRVAFGLRFVLQTRPASYPTLQSGLSRMKEKDIKNINFQDILVGSKP